MAALSMRNSAKPRANHNVLPLVQVAKSGFKQASAAKNQLTIDAKNLEKRAKTTPARAKMSADFPPAEIGVKS